MTFRPGLNALQNMWPPAEVERMKELAAEGLSAAGIAERMGRTRNSVIGKINRLGIRLLRAPQGGVRKLPGHPRMPKRLKQLDPLSPLNPLNPLNAQPAAQRRWMAIALPPPPQRPSAPEIPAIDPNTPLPSSRPCTISQLTLRRCHWPMGDPQDTETFRYCGGRKEFEQSYCSTHRWLAWRPSSRPDGRDRPEHDGMAWPKGGQRCMLEAAE